MMMLLLLHSDLRCREPLLGRQRRVSEKRRAVGGNNPPPSDDDAATTIVPPPPEVGGLANMGGSWTIPRAEKCNLPDESDAAIPPPGCGCRFCGCRCTRARGGGGGGCGSGCRRCRRSETAALFVGEDAVDDEDEDDGVDFLFRVPTTTSSYGAGAS